MHNGNNYDEEGGKEKRHKNVLKKRSGPTFFDKGDVDDHISRLLDARKLVPEEFRGTDKFLDIVSWNIRWFDHKDPLHVAAILDVMETINADLFVLTEIAADGALDDVVNGLAERDAGYYSTAYGTTGEEPRVVLMWDRDWVRYEAQADRALCGGREGQGRGWAQARGVP